MGLNVKTQRTKPHMWCEKSLSKYERIRKNAYNVNLKCLIQN